MAVRTPRGTQDILPREARLWRRFETTAAKVMQTYGFGEIRTPVFEHTELFLRTVGETSDIVQKQMYTFSDQGERSLTLRPEGTAPVVRAFVDHRLYGGALPEKLWYLQPMFRYERPQLGRTRQFHQFGAEMLGSGDPTCDFEVIAAGVDLYDALGITQYEVVLNSIGCDACRPRYRQSLLTFLRNRLDQLCPDCVDRYERNPMRVLDCKNEGCQQATADAPTVTEHLCQPCEDHFGAVKTLLTQAGITFVLDPRLVRGLDYYTNTVFEFITDQLGAQGTILAGGRYDGLVQELGGPALPAVGFGAGIERAIALLQAQEAENANKAADATADVFVVTQGANARPMGIQLARALRREGVRAAWDYSDDIPFEKSMRAQMKRADRSGAKIAVVIGEDEAAQGVVALRDMAGDGGQHTQSFDKAMALGADLLHVFSANERL